MTAERWEQIEKVYHAARECESTVGRAHGYPVRSAVASQLTRYQPPGFASLNFQQPTKEAVGGTLITTG